MLKYPVTVLDPGVGRFYRTVDFEGPPEQLADKIPIRLVTKLTLAAHSPNSAT